MMMMTMMMILLSCKHLQHYSVFTSKFIELNIISVILVWQQAYVMICDTSNPSQREYIKLMWTYVCKLMKKQLVTQYSKIPKFTINNSYYNQRLMKYNNNATEIGNRNDRSVRGISSSTPHSGFQAPVRSPEGISTRAADLRRKTMANMDKQNPWECLPRLSGRIFCQKM